MQSDGAAATLYDVLGVSRDASFDDIRKAYRKQALLSHPDKHPGDQQAVARFLKVSEAYEVLRDQTKRARYDRGGGTGDYQGFDVGRASDLFNASLSQALMRQWRPGLTVSGTLVCDGKKITITIHPDGSTEEEEHAASGRASYLSTTTTMPGGGRMHSIQLRTSLGESLAALLVPDAIAVLPLLGPVATTVVSWVPTVLVASLAAAFFGAFARRRKPGELTDSLTEAFKLSEHL